MQRTRARHRVAMRRAVSLCAAVFVVAADARAQNLYFNYFNSPSRVEKRASDGTLLWTTSGGTGSSWLSTAESASGELFLTRRMPSVAVERFSSSGVFVSEFASPEIASVQGDLDMFADGTLAVCNHYGDAIELYSQAGSHLATITQPGLLRPFGCYVDVYDHLWVIGIPNVYGPNLIATFDRSGTPLQTFSTSYGAGDLVVDPAGDLWLIDTVGTVHHATSAGIELASFATGMPTPCWGIARLDDGSLWVSSFSSTTLRHFSSTGVPLGWFDAASVNAVFIRTEGHCSVPTSYCTAGTSSFGCSAHLSATGHASASAATSFTIVAQGVDGLKQGIVFYGISGTLASPWGSGGSSYSCVKAPRQRATPANSGGTFGSCDGLLSLDWNSYFAAHPGALGTPLQPGTIFYVQAWWRDPPSVKSSILSDALAIRICP